MKSEENIKGYFDYRDVNINHHTYSQIQRLLGYEIKSEYYILLPNESYYPLALLLALAKTKDITKKINTALSSIDAGERTHLETAYFQINDKLTDFNIPEQLSQCVDKFNYNLTLFQKYSKRFEFSLLSKLIEDNMGQFRIRKFEEKAQTVSLKTSRRVCKNQDILLVKQGEEMMIIAGFSDKQSSKKQTLHQEHKQAQKLAKLEETSLIEGEQSQQSQIIEDNRSEQDEHEGETVLQKQDNLLFYFCLVVLVLVFLVTVRVDFLQLLDAYLPNTHIFQTVVSVMSGLKK